MQRSIYCAITTALFIFKQYAGNVFGVIPDLIAKIRGGHFVKKVNEA
jgi:hypothetical protein